MGTDKAFVEVDGRPMISIALEALGDAADVTVIGGDAERIGALGVPYHPDRSPGAGPVPALADALELSAHAITVVLSCDLPSITPAAVHRMVDALGDGECIVPVVSGRPAWIPSAWTTGIHSRIRQAETAGRHSLRSVAQGLRLVHFLDSNPALWHDADRPDELPKRVRSTEAGLDPTRGLH